MRLRRRNSEALADLIRGNLGVHEQPQAKSRSASRTGPAAIPRMHAAVGGVEHRPGVGEVHVGGGWNAVVAGPVSSGRRIDLHRGGARSPTRAMVQEWSRLLSGAAGDLTWSRTCGSARWLARAIVSATFALCRLLVVAGQEDPAAPEDRWW